MTPLMNLLYDYAMDTGFTAQLTTPKYRIINNRLDRLSDDLRCFLSPDAQDTLEQYHDTLQEQRRLELEAMFQATFSLAKELGQLTPPTSPAAAAADRRTGQGSCCPGPCCA